jgi:hypothetical protein
LRPDRDAFADDLFYPAGGKSHTDFRNWLLTVQPDEGPTDRPVIHTKLYQFATTYMLQPLQEHCLHKLHRDLSAISVRLNIEHIIELFRITYANTSAADKYSDGFGAEFRKLICAYANAKEKELIDKEAFRAFLAEEGGELARDMFVLRLKCRA